MKKITLYARYHESELGTAVQRSFRTKYKKKSRIDYQIVLTVCGNAMFLQGYNTGTPAAYLRVEPK